MNFDLHLPFKNFMSKIVIIQIISLTIFTSLALIFTVHSQGRLAKQLSESHRSALVAGDMRRVILEIQSPIFENFLGLSWKSYTNGENFNIPYEFHPGNFFAFGSISVPIFFDEQNRHKAGELTFFYNRWDLASMALLGWMIFTLLSIPIIFLEKKRLIREYNLKLTLQQKESYTLLASQVAHDIRSPLAALSMATKDMADIPEQKRLLIRSAIQRIQDISNDLLDKNRSSKSLNQNAENINSLTVALSTAATTENIQTLFLSSTISSIISEKRLAFRSNMNVDIFSHLNESSYGLFADVDPNNFKRVISNLINNSVEALDDNSGRVEVALEGTDQHILIKIKDNGKGIPPEILARLGEQGVSQGKEKGNGLGVYHAKTSIEKWNGTFKIESTVGAGTTIIITLPKATPPQTFLPKIELPSNSTVVCIDDDTSIHQIWDGRLQSLRVNEHNISVLHFSTLYDAAKWYEMNKKIVTTFLVDYEFLGIHETGLDFIERMGIQDKAALVTSRYEESHVKSRAEKLNLKILPKEMSMYVPIEVKAHKAFNLSQESSSLSSKKLTNIFIDDDKLMRMCWMEEAKGKNISLEVFSESEELFSQVQSYDLDCTFYIDSKLGNGIRGEHIAKKLYDLGFKNLYIATGYEEDKFAHLTFLKGIRGKESPWS